MSCTKISALPAATTLTGAETIPVVQGGVTKKVTTDQFLIKDGSGNVGVGTVSPASKLDVRGQLEAGNGTIRGCISYSTRVELGSLSNHDIGFIANGTTQAVLSTSGNLGVGGVPSAWATSKAIEISGAHSSIVGSFSSVGNTQNIAANAYYDGSTWRYKYGYNAQKYSIGDGVHTWYTAPSGTAGNPISFTQAMTLDASGNLTPGGDNTQNLGSGALRWSTVYAGTGTINTSDAREKTEVRFMAADEIEAAKELSKEIGIYQFLDSVAKKGDKARHHVGLTVQRAIELMKLHGLDPFAYGFICFDKWDDVVVEHPAVEAKAATEAKDEVVDAEGNVIEAAVEAQAAIEAKDAWTEVTLKAGDRYSFRYDQLNLFIARGIEARLAALEAKRWTR